MSQTHLTDNQLQDYLDGNLSSTDPVAIHLENCPRCRQALEIYKSLYSAIEKEPSLELSPDFADAVMQRLPEKLPTMVTESPGRFHIKDSMILFIAATAALAGVIYFVNPDLFIKPFMVLMGTPSIAESQQLTEINGFLSRFNISTLTIIFAVLTFIGIGIIDRIIVHRREQRKSISYLI